MALNPRQFQQLPMFMPAGELYDSVKLMDQHGGSRMRLMNKKTDEAGSSGLLQDVARHGVHEPVELEWHGAKKPSLYEGHHRLAAALHANRATEVPVLHHDVDENIRRWQQEAHAKGVRSAFDDL